MTNINHQLENANFSLSDWLEGVKSSCEINRLDIPSRIDTYSPRSVAWGKDPKRSHAIMGARSEKAWNKNKEYFLQKVLPLIEDKLNSLAWKDLARDFEEHRLDFMRKGGFWKCSASDGRFEFVHPTLEPNKITVAKEVGYILTEDF